MTYTITGEIPMPQRPSLAERSRARGFNLLELSIVLAVIGLLASAVHVGLDVHRSAEMQRLSSDFVQSWTLAYDNYFEGTGVVPGDSTSDPTGRVNQASGDTNELCSTNLLDAMQAAGIRLPEGRAEGAADHAVYLDSNGNPQDVKVCFANVNWTEPGASSGTWLSRPRNVMVLTGLTPSLANMLDSMIDGHVDASLGRFREASSANLASPGNVTWSVDDRMNYGATSATAKDENQVAVVTAWLSMTH